MRVWNLQPNQIQIITDKMGIKTNRLDSDSVATNVTLRPIDSHSKYSRMSYPWIFGKQRHGPWLCYHGFKTFIEECFKNGATRIKSTAGDWKSLLEFEIDERRNLYYKNRGTLIYHVSLGEDCPCECEVIC